MACRFDGSPLIALGNHELERFGPGRSTTTDQNWRAVLRAFAMEAQIILVIPAYTEGTSWEIEWVAANKFLHKTCFLMPPPAPGDEKWWTDNWGKLRRWAVRFGFDLPDYTPNGCVFRLTSEGQLDTVDFSVVYGSGDLKMPLMYQLLFRPNVSWDFLYGVQEGLVAERAAAAPVPGTRLAGAATGPNDDLVKPEDRAALAALDDTNRLEMGNWFYDAPRVPRTPSLVMYFETPFRMLWAEEAGDLTETLSRHSEGVASSLTRAFFHLKILNFLTPQQIDQLSTGALTIESIMSYRVKQIVSYRFVTMSDSEQRQRLLDLIWRGASRHGAPAFARPVEAAPL